MNSLPAEILRAMQAHAARASLTSSSMRGAGSSGVVGAGREYLCHLPLRHFSLSHVTRFRSALDLATNELMRALPRSARHWGLARKGLNIFLRECLYTVYLREHYALGKAESMLEIPLDSLTGNRLYQASEGVLPRWETVRGLQPDISEQYQRMASKLANRRGIARVHLDAVFWGERL